MCVVLLMSYCYNFSNDSTTLPSLLFKVSDKMLKLLVLTSFVSLTYGNICCVPRQWEATEGLLTGSIDDEGHTAITFVGILNLYNDLVMTNNSCENTHYMILIMYNVFFE